METVNRIIHQVPRLMSTPLIVDCNVPTSHGFKQFKSILSTLKQDSIQVLIYEGVFLSYLPSYTKAHKKIKKVSTLIHLLHLLSYTLRKEFLW